MSLTDLDSVVASLRESGFDLPSEQVRIQVPNAKERMMDALRYFLGEDAQWLPCYDEIADWLTDNHGKGLLCMGDCGLGKTVLCGKVIPTILLGVCRKRMGYFSAFDINDHIKAVTQHKLVVIDDVGVEPEAVRYGERHLAFAEIVDNAEKKSNLLVLTTNLRTTHKTDKDGNPLPSIEDKYGNRILDRLKAITKVVKFKGKSFRK